jgi:4a-hydroxytetrahydrobiopterin dehydratase
MAPQIGSPGPAPVRLASAGAADVRYSGGMELLTEDEIAGRLGEVSGWERQGSSITTTVTRKDFRDAMFFTAAVAYLAEQANHHPDILIQWNKVTLTLSTHSAGGLTAADFGLAGQISALG